MSRHPVDDAIARMSKRDQEIANRLAEAGFTDEDLYAALPNPGLDRLLNQPVGGTPKKKTPAAKEGDRGC